MFHEFAVQPEVMATWAHFRELFDDFGPSRGRFICEYPGKWRQMVYQLADDLSPSVRANAIKTKISQHRARLVPSQGRSFDPTASWPVNAQARMRDQPFRAVIATENPSGSGHTLVAGDFDRGAEPWVCPSQRLVPRSGTALADCARLLVAQSNELIFVDPNFDPREPRFSNTFAAILARCSRARSLRRLEIHRRFPDPFVRGAQEDNYRRRLETIIPENVVLRVCLWQRRDDGQRMHGRFLLAEFGGLQYDYGLDEGDSPHEQTVVTLMDDALYQQVRSDYEPSTSPFALPPDAVIEIRGLG